jgi:hypothetical protein
MKLPAFSLQLYLFGAVSSGLASTIVPAIRYKSNAQRFTGLFTAIRQLLK